MEEHPQARFIIETLTKAGYVAYYAGGWVRDFLLGHPSDDIDIATNADPEIIQTLFPKTVPIGIAFGIILVIVDGHEYEVATFRHDFDYQDGRRPSRVEFTTAIEDAKRRDFTINGMFYDPLQEEVLDYVEGKNDLKKKLIRAIGNPHERIKEDRLRMIRAIRLACRFHFTIDLATEKAILTHANELFPSVAIERIVQELEKGHKSRKLQQILIELHKFNLLPTIFPELQGISLSEIERRVKPILHFPHAAPLIAFLLPLFLDLSLPAQIELSKRLKLSNQETSFVPILYRAKELTQQTSAELVEWALFYAQSRSDLCLQILAAEQPDSRRESWLKEHQQRRDTLHDAIERIVQHKPLICANDLAAAGILPGKAMGILLKEAERMAINNALNDKDQVLHLLKSDPALKALFTI